MKIAIVKLSALGDIIHAMVVLQFIKQKYSNSTIDWIVDDCFKDILSNNPDINQIIPLKIKEAKKQKSPKLLLKELNKLRKLSKYDLVIDMQGLIKSAIITKLISAKTRVGFDKNSTREKLASLFYNQKININYGENIINRNICLVEKSLKMDINSLQIDSKKSFLFSKKYNFDELNHTKKNIVLVLGASFSSKVYPIESYSKIVEKIDANFIVIWGSENELNMAKKLQQLQPKITICNKLSLDELKSLISQVELLVGGDTGPSHIAWALSVKAIVLFGATPSWRNAWADKNNILLNSGENIDIYKINKTSGAIKNIDNDVVIKNIKKLIS